MLVDQRSAGGAVAHPVHELTEAGGQARTARGELQRPSEGWPVLSELRVKPCDYAEPLAMLHSWLFRNVLIMNH